MEETKCYCGHTTYCDCGPEEKFGEYLQRLKNRRTEDNYKYTDEDFEKYNDYINNCFKTNLSVYKCLEFMWFLTEEAEDNFKKLNII
jgi:hypothetical protein